jgi:alkanesulfonate monooxygenase SsuD/methylene tetrahydromethanopterin reductase-like flavin-dependent oxidoreductase (luciferase family)
MPVGLSPNTAPPIKSELIAISANYSNLSTTCWPQNVAAPAYLTMVGDPRRLIEQIEEIRETGTNYIIFMINFATLEQKTILASMEIMAKEVIPKFASA